MNRCSRIAACIIGDEILAGRTLDTNSNYLARKCFEYGLSLGHVRVIPDKRDEIVSSIRELSSKYSLVFTSGGIGPTHDDITYESIAEAFKVPMCIHEPTVAAMKAHYHSDSLNSGQMRMATIPRSQEVYPTPGLWVPLVRTENVLILPGVPSLFRRMVDEWFSVRLPEAVKEGSLKVSPRMRISIKTQWKESCLAARLTEIQKEADKDNIALGSYPKLLPDGSTFVIICVSGFQCDQEHVSRIANVIKNEFEGEIVE